MPGSFRTGKLSGSTSANVMHRKKHSEFRTKSKALNLTVAFSEVDSSCQDQVTPSHSTFASLGSETL
jgi:hypothetical protein